MYCGENAVVRFPDKGRKNAGNEQNQQRMQNSNEVAQLKLGSRPLQLAILVGLFLLADVYELTGMQASVDEMRLAVE